MAGNRLCLAPLSPHLFWDVTHVNTVQCDLPGCLRQQASTAKHTIEPGKPAAGGAGGVGVGAWVDRLADPSIAAPPDRRSLNTYSKPVSLSHFSGGTPIRLFSAPAR